MNKPNGWLVAGLCAAMMVCLYQESRIRQRDRLLEAQKRELNAAREDFRTETNRAADADAVKEEVRRKYEGSKEDHRRTPGLASGDAVPTSEAKPPEGLTFPSVTELPAARPPAGVMTFTPGNPPTPEESARLKNEKIIATVAAYDRAYEPFYDQLGLDDAGKRQKFLMLKAKQAEDLTAARQTALRAYVGRSREERDRTIDADTERIYSAFLDNVRESFGENTASAVNLFESSQKSAYKELRPGGTPKDLPAPLQP